MSNLNLNTISSLDTGRKVDVNRVMQTVDYVGGLVIDSLDTVIVDGDDRYVLAASIALPYTTTGAGMPEGDAFVSVGDAKLRGDLVQPVATFDSVADMVNATGLTIGRKVRTLGYYSPGDGGGNDYIVVSSSTGTPDSGSIITMPGSGLRAKAIFLDKDIDVLKFGAVGDGVADDTDAIHAALRLAFLRTYTIGTLFSVANVVFPAGYFRVTDKFYQRTVGGGAGVTRRTSVKISGAGVNNTHILVDTPNGFIEWDNTNPGMRFECRDMSVLAYYEYDQPRIPTGANKWTPAEVDGKSRSGIAFKLTQPQQYTENYTAFFENVFIWGWEGLACFSEGIHLEGGTGGRLLNVQIRGLNTSLVTTRSSVYKMDFGLYMNNHYGPIYRVGEVAGADTGIAHWTTNNPGAEDGDFHHIAVANCRKGLHAYSAARLGEPALDISDSHFNCELYNIYVQRWQWVRISQCFLASTQYPVSEGNVGPNMDHIKLEGVKRATLLNVDFDGFQTLQNTTAVNIPAPSAILTDQFGTALPGDPPGPDPASDVLMQSCRFYDVGTCIKGRDFEHVTASSCIYYINNYTSRFATNVAVLDINPIDIP